MTTGEYSDVEYVFEPHTTSMPPNLREYIASVWERREFMAALAKSDLRSARSNTSLGTVWAVLDPLFQAGIYFFLYIVLRGGGAAAAAFLPVLVGNMFLFQLSMAALGDGGASIKRAKGLMLNSTFPRALLPVTAVYKSIRSFGTNAAVFVVLFPLLGGKFGPGLFLLPLLFALQTVMSIGNALLVSTYITLVPDGTNVMNYVTRILFFATPVIYPVSLLPPAGKVHVAWQPLFALFASYQAVFSGTLPSFASLMQVVFWSFALLILGGYFFLRREREFTIHL
jgi:teichoic acid transport system permease protein